jgi:hypothetical protein
MIQIRIQSLIVSTNLSANDEEYLKKFENNKNQ